MDKYTEEMDKLYEEQMSYLQSKDSKAQFVASQNDWLKYMNASCLYESWPANGGTLEPQLQALSMADLTAERIKRLKTYLACRQSLCPD